MTFVILRKRYDEERLQRDGQEYDLFTYKDTTYLMGEGPNVLRVIRTTASECDDIFLTVPITNERTLDEIIGRYTSILEEPEMEEWFAKE